MKLGLLRLSTIFVLVFILAYSIVSFRDFVAKPMIAAGQDIIYFLPPGGSLTTCANDLNKMGYLQDPQAFLWAAWWFHISEKKLKAGEYDLRGPLSPLQVLKIIASGQVIQHKLTLVEGWTFKQALQAVNEEPNLTHKLHNRTPAQIMAILGHNGQFYEGEFYPDTYLFPKGTTDIEFLRRAYKIMQQHLTQIWQTRQSGLPYHNAYEALIAASLIEKETSVVQEKPIIAGVLVRRLQKGMLLQIDPTVIYGLGQKYKNSLKHEDLQIATAYNTYLNKGLPPTPIALPSLNSLQAAVNPDQSGVLYYVAKGDGSGRHVFSKTYTAHEQAVQQYIKNLKTRIAKPITSNIPILIDFLNSSEAWLQLSLLSKEY